MNSQAQNNAQHVPSLVKTNSEALCSLVTQARVNKNNYQVNILTSDLTPYVHQEFGFIDPDFPHVLSSITGADNEIDETIEWLPAESLTESTTYAQSIEAIGGNLFDKASATHALTLINWFANQTCAQLLGKELSAEHLYRFDVMVEGVFMTVAIDSYIPIHSTTRQEIFTKHLKGSIFPCLYQKLLAKIYGNYYSITTEFMDIVELQTFFCRQEVSTTQDISLLQLHQVISQKIEEKSIVSFRTRNSIRLSSFGLESNHVYVILRVIEKEDGPIVEFLELEGQNWIGRMAKGRSNWLLEQAEFVRSNKIILNEEYKQNYMTLSDMKGVSRELVILNNTSNYHKNFHSRHSNHANLTMYRISLEQRNHLMLRINYKQKKCYNSLFLIEQTEEQGGTGACSYRLVKSQFHENKDSNYMELFLDPGEYAIIAYQSHPQQTNLAFNLTIFSSDAFLELTPMMKPSTLLEVLEATFKAQLQKYLSSSQQQIIFKHLYPTTGMAFIYLKPAHSEIKLSLNLQMLQESKIFPVNLSKAIEETHSRRVRGGERQLLVFRCLWNRKENITFDYQTKQEIQKIVFPPIGSVKATQRRQG